MRLCFHRQGVHPETNAIIKSIDYDERKATELAPYKRICALTNLPCTPNNYPSTLPTRHQLRTPYIGDHLIGEIKEAFENSHLPYIYPFAYDFRICIIPAKLIVCLKLNFLI